ncbi:MAG: flagellar FlbD family protein [Bacillota bacterium]
MIKLKKMNGEEIVVNIDLVETVQATPDTVISLSTGKKILVDNDVEDIIDKVLEYKRKIYSSGFAVEKE